ncbi:MAG: sel1 repeat family protein [Alphaproteobacteria bacterium]|nr:sel1 repeat family protein [Alphaproteobacteria bacterium]
MRFKAPLRICSYIVLLNALATYSQNVLADITTSNITFTEAVNAVKEKNYQHAVNLFEIQANAAQHDAQYNLALLLKSGKGRPQNYQQALIWAWCAYLGGIEPAEKLSEEIRELLPDDALKSAREQVEIMLKDRIDTGNRPALMHLALFHQELAEKPDFEEAYVWYSIASAFLLDGSILARNEAEDSVDVKSIVKLQVRANDIFDRLSVIK